MPDGTTPATRASIGGATRLYAILADPAGHVLTPALVNARFDALGHDGALVPWHVEAGDLPAAVAAMRALRNLGGAVVTMPHKEAILPLLDDLTQEARLVGAVNCVRREADGRLVGAQFDGEGFVAALLAAGHAVAGARVYLAGAGGAAAGIAFALLRHGAAALTVHNRGAAKAEALAARARAAYPDAEAVAGGPDPAGHGLVVNATSVGLRPGDPSPIAAERMDAGAVAADAIIRPEVTPFLAAAAARGHATHGGRPMLAAQVALFARFMGAEDASAAGGR